MKLEFHIQEDRYKRIIKTPEGEIDFENQMKMLWDITEVEKINL